MCGRYVLKTTSLELARELHLDQVPELEARYNLAPLQAAPIVTEVAPRELTLARWGLLPPWAKDARIASKLINARAESVARKPVFKELLRRQRCLVPCDGFYEWQHSGRSRTPYYVHLAQGGLLTMAGLWSTWRSHEGLEVTTFAVVTTAANPPVARLHDRMPAFIPAAARELWLSPDAAEEALEGLLVPWSGPALEAYQVSPLVNSVAHDTPQCLEPARVVQLELF